MIRVKVCGLRHLEEVVAAAEEGAHYVGMVFVPGSRRRLQETEAGHIISAFRKAHGSQGTRFVGLFADQPLKQVNDSAEALGLDMVQLCGEEDLDYCSAMRRPVIKVLHVKSTPQQQVLQELHTRLSALEARGHLAVLDAYQEGVRGGSGKAFDWSIARELAGRRHTFLLAGGLTPENVGDAIRTVHPYGVDVSSGVETGGAKELKKIRAFVATARRADEELGLQDEPQV